MKQAIIRFVIGNAIRLGISYALKIVTTAINNLRDTLNNGGITDDARSSIVKQVNALLAVQDFLKKLSDIVGVPELPFSASDVDDSADKLRKITDSL